MKRRSEPCPVAAPPPRRPPPHSHLTTLHHRAHDQGGAGRGLGAGDLVDDIAETTDIAGDHPDVVARLQAAADTFRAELGDAMTGARGSGRRAHGVVDEATTLTTLDDDHPMVIAEYDLPDRG